MVFNSVVFLFCFMPLALGIYYLAPARTKNAVLLGESLIFYCWTGVRWLPLILALVAVGAERRRRAFCIMSLRVVSVRRG